MAKKRLNEKIRKDSLLTVPTFLNILRIVLSFVIIYMIITGRDMIAIVVVFAIAAITDWFDGAIARKYKLVSDFGAKADMLADRFLWIGTALVFLIVLGIKGQLDIIHAIQLLFIMAREIISAPFAIVAFFSGSMFPKARYIAKVTTFAQGFGLPALMLSVFYPGWGYLSAPLSVFIAIIGTISGLHYIKDVQKLQEAKK